MNSQPLRMPVGAVLLLLLPVLALGAAESSVAGDSAAGAQAPPDELTLNLGAITNIGTNVTIVLTKRSVRSDTYALVLRTKQGDKRMDSFPVRTYRGYVKDNPAMRVNANIEPGGMLNANFSEGQGIVWQIVSLKIDVPPGKATALMSAGNKVVPAGSLRPRPAAANGGYEVPRYPMQRIRFTVYIEPSYMAGVSNNLDLAVAQAEQRINAADFVYARDAAVAWELNNLVVVCGETLPVGVPRLSEIAMDHPDRGNEKGATFYVKARGNVNKGGHAFVSGTGGSSASVLLHEVGHAFGLSHHLDEGDAMQGCGEFIGPHNSQIVIGNIGGFAAPIYPLVRYNGALPPRAMEDFANTRKDAPVTVAVLDNDYDGNGDELLVQASGPSSEKGGSLAVSADRKTVIYTPAPGFVGLDRFTYSVVDSTGAASRSGRVKVAVCEDGLASHFSFDKIAEIVEQPLRRRVLLHYGFADEGPFRSRASGYEIEHLAGQGIRGSSIYCTGSAFGQVNADNVGDPGLWSLSVSLWIWYPQPLGPSGVIVEKGGIAYAPHVEFFQSGWAIAHFQEGKGFTFRGKTTRGRPEDMFDLQWDEPIRTNTWYHLVMVMDRDAKKLRAWVNNAEVLKSTTTSVIPDGPIEYWTPLRLFNAIVWKKGGWQAFPCVMDEVRIYTSALTPKQVADLYAEGKNAKAPELKGAKPKPASPAKQAGDDE